ncbi:Ras-specific guanine nucleotide-releasing factor RalGPS1, partial [Dinochytrium kinnereticum]
INSFNSLSRFVTLSIISMRSTRDRVKVLKNHIRLAQNLVTGSTSAADGALLGRKGPGPSSGSGAIMVGRRNFDSAMAIVSALQGAAVARLKGTWKDLSHKYRMAYEDLCNLLSPKSNYKLLRASVRDAQGIPCIPYLGSILIPMVKC